MPERVQVGEVVRLTRIGIEEVNHVFERRRGPIVCPYPIVSSVSETGLNIRANIRFARETVVTLIFNSSIATERNEWEQIPAIAEPIGDMASFGNWQAMDDEHNYPRQWVSSMTSTIRW